MTAPSSTAHVLTGAAAQRLFATFPDAPMGPPLLDRTYEEAVRRGEYRAEWTFVAERAGTVVARAAFWAGPDDTEPVVMDWFDVAEGEEEAGAHLLRVIPLRAEYELILPPAWHQDPAIRAAAETRIRAAEAADYRTLVERYRYRWTPADGLPERRPGRLVFEPIEDDGAVLDLLRRIEHGTRDAHALAAIEAGGIEQAAREELEHLHWLSSPRTWWRLARTPEGVPVGLHVPGRIPSGPAAAFIGVVPEQRGNGYAYDLLTDCTHFLAGQGAGSIAATTDTTNTAMAATFTRAHYPVIQHRYCMAPPLAIAS